MNPINNKEWKIVFNGNHDDSCVVTACNYPNEMHTHEAIKNALEARCGLSLDPWDAYCLETGDYQTGSEI